jgi:N-acetyl-alpha-D-glucosaminyl L-malate synthase BshA
MPALRHRPLSIGIVCYPLIGGSGILATELGHELANRGHTVHFFSYKPPVRLELERERIHFHPVEIGEHSLFPHPDYTLPLAVRLAEVASHEEIDLFHVHYAVPHATAAFLAGDILGPDRPRIVTTLHGTDTTLFGRDPNYRLAIEHALARSDAVTTVSHSLKAQTVEAFNLSATKVTVIHNFFEAEAPTRTVEAVRREVGAEGKFLLLHMSNLRRVKRIDLLLEVVAASRFRESIRLVILAGGDFTAYEEHAARLGIRHLIEVVQNAGDVENYLQAADAGLYTSEAESFGLSILESMFHHVPVLAFEVGGIPEVVVDGQTGILRPFGDVAALAAALDLLVEDAKVRQVMGQAGEARARREFTAEAVIPRYEAIYDRVLRAPSVSS